MTQAAPGGAPRFLCDEMLGRLGRYLRAAGYDTLVASGGRPDADLLRQAREEGRYFLTLDRLIIEHKAAEGVAFLLPRGDLDRLSLTVANRFGIDWLGRSFTRCLVDNTPLESADTEQRRTLPSDLAGREVRHCPTCGRVYWAGSHYHRMRARLAAWQAAGAGSGDGFRIR